MSTYCHVCAQPIEGPYSSEKIPPGVTSNAFFVKCQSCTSKYPGITFASTAGRSPTRSSFEYSFYECEGCGSLFYCGTKGIPFAYSNFNAETCPNCGQSLPTGEQIDFEPSDTAPLMALMNGFPGPLEKMQPLYETLTEAVPKHLTLSKIVTNIMLVNTPKGHDIWVIYQADLDFSSERAMVTQLRKLVDNALVFMSGQQLQYALNDDVTIVEQNEV